MKVVVESINNQIVSDYCFKGWLGATNLDHDVKLLSLSGASMIQNQLKKERPMPIGSVYYMKYFFDLYDIICPKPLNIHKVVPDVHEDWKEVKGINNILNYPRFVKPLNEVKKFTGFVAKSIKDFELYPEVENWDGELLTCKPFEFKIQSEWRCFIHEDKIINISCYSGDSLYFPIPNEIEQLIKLYSDYAPVAYTLDFAVSSEGITKFIEANDMWAIGPYGCKEEDYFTMLKDRWNEIIRQ